MGRNAQLIRQWAILKQIETNRWTTILDIAEQHVVSTKTIRRDLAALMEAGFPLYDERYDGKVYWRLNEEYKGLPLASLSLSETAALYFSKKLVVNLAAPPFSNDIASAFKKIQSALPERNIQFLDSLDSMISVRADAPKDLDHSKNTIRILMEAIGEEVRVCMQYFSVHSQQKKTYTIDPYRLMYFRGGLYLFAHVEEYKQIRTFAVERIESIEKTKDEFEKPPDFSVESYLESAFGVVKEDPFDVEIIFNKDVSEYVRSRVWHPSQVVREIGGGRITMKMHVGGEFELGSWILSFGSSATVVSPERLRRRVEAELGRALENYPTEVTVAPRKSRKVESKKAAAAGVRRS
ncbi:MAG TPA: WYL domain-containing transcriptional regulator [Terriglobia bacterium]|nr:WYL domain-containing transcriptional regulator [Terriglobia bacterium]